MIFKAKWGNSLPSHPVLSALIISIALVATSAYAQPVVVLDAGHEPAHPGAIASCGKQELFYNDAVVSALADELGEYHLLLTRKPQADVPIENKLQMYLSQQAKQKWLGHESLYARAAIANENNADVFLSIHHDATAEHWQISDGRLCNGNGGIKLSPVFKQRYQIGFNIFINDDKPEPCRSRSLQLAEQIAKGLLALGRQVSDYHQDDCQSCRSVNARLGIWHQDLAVLREAAMPAVLIEVGTIVDVEDEAVIATATFRKQFAQVVKTALAAYFAAKPLGKQKEADAYSACFFL